MNQVTIVDYGIGNLFSVAHAFRHCGATVTLAETAQQIRDAERLVLPGVGAFQVGMQELRQRHLVEPILQFVTRARPFLGICLGMQMLFGASEEFDGDRGLDLIPGPVQRIPATTKNGLAHKIPHIGWNRLRKPASQPDWSKSLLKYLNEDSAVYFVHSYTGAPLEPKDRLADCDYGGRLISAVVARENLFGCQFHPEKSGANGLKIIEAFLEL